MHADVNYYSYPSPFGKITLAENGKGLIYLGFGDIALDGNRRTSQLLNKAANELQEYLALKRTSFDIPLCPIGTDFEMRVWQELTKIPFGSTETSSVIASKLGNTQAHQAVGRAARKNPIPIFIPNHRLITPTPTSLSIQLCKLEQQRNLNT